MTCVESSSATLSPKPRDTPMTARPRAYPLYPYEIITRLSTRGQLDYSAFPVPVTTLDDFNPEELKRLRDILARNRNSDQTLLGLS